MYICECSKLRKLFCRLKKSPEIYKCKILKWKRTEDDIRIAKEIENDMRNSYFSNGQRHWR